jgi:hypothetical protein
VYKCVLVGILVLTAYFVLFRGSKEPPKSPEPETEKKQENAKTNDNITTKVDAPVSKEEVKGRVEMRVVFGSTTGTAKRFAQKFASKVPKEAKLLHQLPAGGTNPLVTLNVPAPEDADSADPWDMLESSNDAVTSQLFTYSTQAPNTLLNS